MSYRALGTGSGHAADGAHTHSYASTTHAATHAGAGSDPLIEIEETIVGGTATQDGTGHLGWKTQTTKPGQPVQDTQYRMYYEQFAYGGLLSHRGYNKPGAPVDPFLHPWGRWTLIPNNGTATAPMFGTVTETGTKSHTTAAGLGYRTRYTTAATGNATASAESVKLAWCRGDGGSTILWPLGMQFIAVFSFADASYNASGATTGSRIFCGFTDRTVAQALGTDNVASSSHFGFQRVNVNGGKTQTNFFSTQKDATTEHLTDTGIAMAQDNFFLFSAHIFPGGAYTFYELRNLSTGASSGAYFDGDNVAATGTFMRFMFGIQTINAVARSMDLHFASAWVPLD